MTRWYYSVAGKAEGPVTQDYLIGQLRTGRFTLVDLVFQEGEAGWRTFGEIPEFREAYQAPPLNAPMSSGVKQPANEISLNDETAVPTSFNDTSFKPLEEMIPESTTVTEFMKPIDGWPSDWRLSSSWIILRKRDDGGGYEQDGPFTAEHIIEMIGSGKIQYSQYCWKPGYTRWFRIGNLPEFDRRKRDREGDPVNQIIPIPAIDEALPALTREELLMNVEKLRRERRAAEKPPAEAMTRNLVEDAMDRAIPPHPSNERVMAGPIGSTANAATPPPAPVMYEAASADHVQGHHVHNSHEDAHSAPMDHSPIANADHAMFDATAPGVPPSHRDSQKRVPSKALRVGLASLVAIAAVFIVSHLMGGKGRTPASEQLKPKAPAAAPAKPKVSEAAKPASATESPAPPIAPAAPKIASEIEITPVALDSAKPGLTFTTDMNATDKITLKISAHSGDILKFGSFVKSVEVAQGANGIPLFDLSTLELPMGSYTVEASVGKAHAVKQIFVGVKDDEFLGQLERHIKSISYRQQAERSALYYGSKSLERLAKDLLGQSQSLKSKPAKWKKAFASWRTAAKDAMAPVTTLAQSPVIDQAFPEEIAAFQMAAEKLAMEAKEVDANIDQKRDVASNGLDQTVADFNSLRENSAKLTGRPHSQAD